MFRPLTKESVKQFQAQVLSQFQSSDSTEERAALLELAQSLENTMRFIQERKKGAKEVTKDLSLIDPLHALESISKKGEMAYSGEYERLAAGLLKQAK